MKEKIKPIPKPKKEKISTLKKLADKYFSIYIRQRDNGKCFTCGIQRPWREMQNGHYITRGNIALRYEEVNNHCQCPNCNIWLKGNYTTYAVKMMEKYGDDILYDLDEVVKESKRNPKKYSTDFYKGIIEKYKPYSTM